MTMTDKIRRLIKKGKTAKEIAAKLKVPANRVHTVKWLDKKASAKISKNHTSNLAKAIKNTTAEFAALEKEQDWGIALETRDHPPADLVNHPPHYKSGGIETIDFIEAKDLNYRLGNVVKYVVRCGKKDTDPVQDLEKAMFYLRREIATRKGA